MLRIYKIIVNLIMFKNSREQANKNWQKSNNFVEEEAQLIH